MQVANTLLARPAEGSFRNEEIGRFWTHVEQYFASMAAVVVKNCRGNAAGAGEAEEDAQTADRSRVMTFFRHVIQMSPLTPRGQGVGI
jgi:hypothetical protein